MKKTTLLIFSILLLPRIILAQYLLQNDDELNEFNSIAEERVFIHYNDNLLLTGEYLYYQFYSLNSANNTPSQISKIGYVELVDENGKQIFRHKINLKNALGQGDFFIPVNVDTGHYKLVGYTNWNRNTSEDSLFIADLVIVNPFKELPYDVNDSTKKTLEYKKIDSLSIEITTEESITSHEIILPKKTYKKREIVKLEINKKNKNECSNFSISVRKKDSVALPFRKNKTISITKNVNKKIDLNSNDSIFLPELRGELISGRIENKLNGLPATNQNISLSIEGENGLTKISQSNKNGAFYFNLENSNRTNKVFLNILGNQKNEFKIVLDATQINTSSFNYERIGISHNLNLLFEKRSIYNQIENAFFNQKSDSLIDLTNPTPVYKIFDEIYNLDDYTRFSSLEETLIEILDNVLVKKRKGQYRIQIRENDYFFIDTKDAPLLLVDNILVQNSSDLFNYDVKKIQRIGISRSEYYIGPKKYQGIFSIETKEGDYSNQIKTNSLRRIEIDRPLPIKEYYFQDYSGISSSNKKHIPDFRQQLLWLPGVKLNETNTFEFYTSDNTGTYEISIEGFTENGQPISLIEYIYVE